MFSSIFGNSLDIFLCFLFLSQKKLCYIWGIRVVTVPLLLVGSTLRTNNDSPVTVDNFLGRTKYSGLSPGAPESLTVSVK